MRYVVLVAKHNPQVGGHIRDGDRRVGNNHGHYRNRGLLLPSGRCCAESRALCATLPLDTIINWSSAERYAVVRGPRNRSLTNPLTCTARQHVGKERAYETHLPSVTGGLGMSEVSPRQHHIQPSSGTAMRPRRPPDRPLATTATFTINTSSDPGCFCSSPTPPFAQRMPDTPLADRIQPLWPPLSCGASPGLAAAPRGSPVVLVFECASDPCFEFVCAPVSLHHGPPGVPRHSAFLRFFEF